MVIELRSPICSVAANPDISGNHEKAKIAFGAKGKIWVFLRKTGSTRTPIRSTETAHYIPFDGYTVEYMKFLLRHDREAIQAERDLLEANRKTTVGWGV